MTNQKFILNENHQPVPVDLLVWARWFENIENRRVALDKIGDAEVSTVFLGLDHNFSDGPPLLFETMVFKKGKSYEQECYSTWDEAVAGHKRLVKALKKLQ